MLNYLKDHFVVHHGLWSHVSLKDRCNILCRFACSLLSSCFFSFVCDLDVACCRLHCDCQPHLTHWNISTSLAPHMVVQGRDLLHQKVLKVRWPEKRKSDFVLFTLDYFSCVLGIFFNEFLFPVNIHKPHTGEYTFFCAVCTCLWNASAALQFVWVETLHWMVEYLDSKQGKGHSEILSLFSEGIKKYVT